MKRTLFYIILIGIFSAILFFSTSSAIVKQKDAKMYNGDNNSFVIMELFTSQGCSSCPPADAILGSYADKNDERIISMAFHVNYWNRLGWIDSFSNAAYSQRQNWYAQKLNAASVYTPQIIINGQKQMVGSDEGKISSAVNTFLKEKALVTITITSMEIIKNEVQLTYKINGDIKGLNINGSLLQKKAVTQINRGENRGVKLENYNVVRDFKTIDQPGISGKMILQLPAGDDALNYLVVLFAQDAEDGLIKAAVKQNCK